MSDAETLWTQLRSEYPEQCARVAGHIEPVQGNAQELLDRMLGLRQSAAAGNDRSGYVGNPYEQPAEDMGLLLAAAERMSGLAARSPGAA